MNIMVIDGENLLYRTYYAAFEKLQKKNNKIDDISVSSHILYFLRSMKSYIEIFRPLTIFCTWDYRDEGNKNLRSELFADYKNNKEINEKVVSKCSVIRSILDSLGVIQIHPKNREADDIIYWLCAIKYPNESVCISSDSDMYQMLVPELNKNVIYHPVKKIVITSNFLKTSYGVNDGYEYSIYKALKGDFSDNITGIGDGEFFSMNRNRVRAIINALGKNFDIHKVLEQNLLNEKDIGKFLMNYELISLNKLKEYPEEIDYYQSQLNSPPKANKKEFKEYLKKYDLINLYKNSDSWFRIFNPFEFYEV